MHDPATAPDATWWLSLDEITRGDELRAWHLANPNPALHGHMPNLDLHCSMHAVVETQIAEHEPPIVAATVTRLVEEGVNRHAIVHAIMDALVMQMHVSMTADVPFDPEAYEHTLLNIEAADLVARGLRRAQAVLAAEDDDDDDGPAMNRAQRRALKKKAKKQ